MADVYETKHALVEALKVLMRKSPSFSKITVDEICETAYVSRRNFYRYFQDKYDLLNWLYYDEFCEPLNRKNIQHSIELIPFVCDHLYSDRVFYRKAFDVTGQNSFRDFCKERLFVYMERDFGAAFQTESEKKFYIEHILDAVFDAFQIWLAGEPCEPPEAYSKKMVDSVTRFAVQFAVVVQP